ncbi:MAG TPA: TetR/AcrR family transcriptional regulator [Candidatus Acetothermia bacterium]|nr:TetR/AcrR family transcriptional regulator [Candidatus Acetothermia bacterium]
MTTEERIRGAAIRVFSREGFHRARMREIAEEAGIAVGSIYNYFASKEELLISLFEEEFEARLSFLEELQRRSAPIRETLQRLLEEHFSFVRIRPELAQLLLRERFNRGGKLSDRLIVLQRRMVERIGQIISRGIEDGWIRPCDPTVVAQGLYDLIQTMSACGIVYEKERAEEILKAAPEELASLIWQGLKAGAGDEAD